MPDHLISFEDAGALTSRYRASMGEGDRKGGFFVSEAIQTLLNQPYSIGMRYYYGLDADNKQVLVLCAVDVDGNDMVLPGNVCYELSIPCPDACSENNILNSDPA